MGVGLVSWVSMEAAGSDSLGLLGGLWEVEGGEPLLLSPPEELLSSLALEVPAVTSKSQFSLEIRYSSWKDAEHQKYMYNGLPSKRNTEIKCAFIHLCCKGTAINGDRKSTRLNSRHL